MANTKSASKRARQSARRTLRNRRVLTRLRSLTKETVGVTAEKSADSAVAARALISHLDKAAKRGILHRNAANRRKSRLLKAIAVGSASA